MALSVILKDTKKETIKQAQKDLLTSSNRNFLLSSNSWSMYFINLNKTWNKVAKNRFLWIFVLLFLSILQRKQTCDIQ